MAIKDWPGGIVTKDQIVPAGPYADGVASGIWTLDQASNYTKLGIWPTAGNIAPNIADAFSTDLYEGNNGTLTISNGINFSGDGGLLWIKCRDNGQNHVLTDTSTTGGDGSKYMNSNTTTVQQDFYVGGGSDERVFFNSTGFSTTTADFKVNNTAYDYVAWSFEKSSRFFDVVNYTGNATNRTIPHSLGVVPGMIIVRNIASGYSWQVYHRGMSNTDRIELDGSGAKSTGATTYWNSTSPTSSVFSLGTVNQTNNNGDQFIAYLFAHDTAADSMVQCGSYTGNNSTQSITLGFEPQWLMIKNTSAGAEWVMLDTSRGLGAQNANPAPYLKANNSNTEADGSQWVATTATGFDLTNTSVTAINTNGNEYIYVAIRNPMQKAPTTAASVFQPQTYTGNNSTRVFTTTITPDMVINSNLSITGDARAVNDRLRGGGDEVYTDQNGSEAVTGSAGMQFDYTKQIEVQSYRIINTNNYLNLCWKRAKGFFDVVNYIGDGTSSNTNRTAPIPHNLGVQPEMVWIKGRSAASEWVVAHKDYGAGYLNLNNSLATFPVGGINFDDAFTATNFKINGWQQEANFNTTGGTYISYLFATVEGVSKVGSYTGDGTSGKVINCDFSGGSSFVMVKRADSTGNWWVVDSGRGFNKNIAFNDANTQTSYTDIGTDNSGFTVTDGGSMGVNVSGATYIFYAIASI